MNRAHFCGDGRMRPICLAALVLGCGAFLLTAACGPKTPPVTTSAAPAVMAQAPVAAKPPQAAPVAAKPPAPAPPPLLGHLSRAQLKAYESWQPLFAAAPYVPDPAAIATVKSGAQGVTVLLIMATWCPDSKRELPRYFAIADAAGVADATLTMVGVDRTKKDGEGLTEKWGITRVPTFVFFRNGQEVGRVIERVPAGTTLEAEIAKILGGK